MWKLRTTPVNVTDLCRQVILQSARCADRNLFLFLGQFVLPFQSGQCQQHWSQTAQIMVLGQRQCFWKPWRNGGTSAKNSPFLSWGYSI